HPFHSTIFFSKFYRRFRRPGQYPVQTATPQGKSLMVSERSRSIVEHLRNLAEAAQARATPDAELIEAFVANRSEAAFAALVRRHGPMVLNLCRRVLGNHQDAEDAFQATFLVLARKAASLRDRPLVGSWLYGVAHRTAAKALTARARRAARE